jgi:hypothetical protein
VIPDEKIAQGESRKIMKWLWAALWTSFGIVSAQGFTCADVRTLSLEQQAYYIKVFNITPAQQGLIRRECDAPKTRHATTSVEAPTNHLGMASGMHASASDASHCLALSALPQIVKR